MDRFIKFCKENKWATVLGAVGLLVTILLFSIGFFRTLILVAVVGGCFYIGYLLDKGGVDAVKRFFKNLFSKKDIGA